MQDQFQRLRLTFGQSLDSLFKAKVAVFGIGGVGGYVVEALVRSGVSNFVLVDSDTVQLSNINRQIIASLDTVGKYKCDVMKERILSINKDANVECHKCFFLPENKAEFDFSSYDYVIDCVDTVTAKIAIVLECNKTNTKVISAMGAGNKINPSMLMVSDIYKTKVDPLSKVMRIELKKRGIKKLKVVYSVERPIKPLKDTSLDLGEQDKNKRSIAGSNAFVPPSMGLLIASEVVKDLTGVRNDSKGA